jgi:hypothetical protein
MLRYGSEAKEIGDVRVKMSEEIVKLEWRKDI